MLANKNQNPFKIDIQGTFCLMSNLPGTPQYCGANLSAISAIMCRSSLLFVIYRGQGSNLHTFRHLVLSQACLPFHHPGMGVL